MSNHQSLPQKSEFDSINVVWKKYLILLFLLNNFSLDSKVPILLWIGGNLVIVYTLGSPWYKGSVILFDAKAWRTTQQSTLVSTKAPIAAMHTEPSDGMCLDMWTDSEAGNLGIMATTSLDTLFLQIILLKDSPFFCSSAPKAMHWPLINARPDNLWSSTI